MGGAARINDKGANLVNGPVNGHVRFVFYVSNVTLTGTKSQCKFLVTFTLVFYNCRMAPSVFVFHNYTGH